MIAAAMAVAIAAFSFNAALTSLFYIVPQILLSR
jgi:hypothetical protein